MSRSPSPLQRVAALDLLAATKYAKDDEDETRFAACWTTDARLEITSNGTVMPTVEGRDEIIAFYRQVWASGGHGKHGSKERHVAEHPDILALDDGSLVARHTIAFFYADQCEPRLRGFGEFRDVIVNEGGSLRISHRTSILTRTT
ncbi:nuclear transport factor 2 family protein [Hyphomonas johnsonii]|uniref:SnoaL-like domain-containing protein n=1 Tax=Hyphomonas johnsonii MHS-2 TaxID=1280950 RepID=A0A059FUA2_9PROT|nr:nuclear transport factor 2 family protein [Hyphomonas johnsonii]KCZ94259.1 hypothetical protein HJO_02755 [Hyphomonas johnsonii MHS-2]